MPSSASWLHALVIVLTFAGVAVGRVPGLNMNRATIAVVGATLLVLLGALGLEEAYASLDLDTLVLLFSMMVLNANLRVAGFFGVVAEALLRRARTPRRLLFLLMMVAGLLSALFLNDTIVLVFTPLLLEVVLALRRDPLPYLVGLGTAANIGSVAAITGNPQNMLIGASAGIPFVTFSAYLLPVAVAGLLAAWGVVVVVYRAEMGGVLHVVAAGPVPRHVPLLRKGAVAVVVLLACLLAGVDVALAALYAAALLLVTRRLHPEQVFAEIDWSLLVFFAGLFVVTGAVTTTGLGALLFGVLGPLAAGGIPALTLAAALLSNVVSNVPAVMLFRPFVPSFPQPEAAWLTLAMATTLAGNLTLLGSVANLIVAELAARQGVRLSFAAFLRAGVPVTLLTLALGTLWLMLVT